MQTNKTQEHRKPGPSVVDVTNGHGSHSFTTSFFLSTRMLSRTGDRPTITPPEEVLGGCGSVVLLPPSLP